GAQPGRRLRRGGAPAARGGEKRAPAEACAGRGRSRVLATDAPPYASSRRPRAVRCPEGRPWGSALLCRVRAPLDPDDRGYPARDSGKTEPHGRVAGTSALVARRGVVAAKRLRLVRSRSGSVQSSTAGARCGPRQDLSAPGG